MECVTKRITWLLIKINVCLYLWALSKLRFVNYLKAMLQAGNQLSYTFTLDRASCTQNKFSKGERGRRKQNLLLLPTRIIIMWDLNNSRSYIFFMCVCVQKRKILYKHTGWKVKIKKAKITLSFYTWRANMHLCLHC